MKKEECKINGGGGGGGTGYYMRVKNKNKRLKIIESRRTLRFFVHSNLVNINYGKKKKNEN